MNLNSKLFIQYVVIASLIILIGSISIYQFEKIIFFNELKENTLDLERMISDIHNFNRILPNIYHDNQIETIHQNLLSQEQVIHDSRNKYQYIESQIEINYDQIFESLDKYIAISKEHIALISQQINDKAYIENFPISDNSMGGDLENFEYLKSEEFQYITKLEKLQKSIKGLISESINNINSEIIAIKNRNLRYIILAVSISFIVAMVYAYLNSQNVSIPIINLSNAVEEITKGNFNAEIKGEYIRRNDEIGRLALSLQRVVASMKLAILRIGMSKEELGFGFKNNIPNKKIILGNNKRIDKNVLGKPLSNDELSNVMKGLFTNYLGPLGLKYLKRLPDLRDKKAIIESMNILLEKGILEQGDFQKFKKEIILLNTSEVENKKDSDGKL
jgi:HAMP domain-containing protein